MGKMYELKKIPMEEALPMACSLLDMAELIANHHYIFYYYFFHTEDAQIASVLPEHKINKKDLENIETAEKISVFIGTYKATFREIFEENKDRGIFIKILDVNSHKKEEDDERQL